MLFGDVEKLIDAFDQFVFTQDTGTKPSDIENKVTVSAFARRRLAVVMVRLKMAETVADVSVRGYWPPRTSVILLNCLCPCPFYPIHQAVRTIEQGHVRVGPNPISDPAMMVTRNMEDFITWVDGSSRKRTIMKYNDEVSEMARSPKLEAYETDYMLAIIHSWMTLTCCRGVFLTISGLSNCCTSIKCCICDA